ncbi:MAG: hypothetical protein E7324_09950 [Clostridiales bacterium]|nr:hypothetical protein [Clostridiales bacterium]
MTTRKFGRTLLVAALALSLVLSITGGTIAWFTDSVESSTNVITAGNLDVELYHTNKTIANEKVGTSTKLFKIEDNTLWEPGMVAWENLTVKNEGSLHLYYDLGINVSGENYVIDGNNQYGLSGVLKMAVLNETIDASASRDAVMAKAQNGALLATASHTGDLAAGASKTYGVIVYWEPSANDNNWNVNNSKTTSDNQPLHITLGVKLNATQMDAEKDAFDKDYDADAKLVKSYNELQAALNAGEPVVLEKDITLPSGSSLTIPQGATVTLNLNGKKITGSNIKDSGALIINNGTVTITGGTVENTKTNGDSVIKNNGTMVLDDVAINGAPIGETGYPAYAVTNEGNLTIEDGTSITSDRGAMILKGTGETIINGGNFTLNDIQRSLTAHVVCVSSAAQTLTVNGGTFNHLDRETSGGVVIVNMSTGTINVNGGSFNGGKYITGQNNMSDYGFGGTFNVKGGTFDTKPTAKYIAAGYEVTDNGNGTWTVSLPKASTAAELKTAISAGKTVELDGKVAVEDLTYVGAADKEATIVGGTLSRDTASGNPLLVNTTAKVTFEGVKFESVKGSAVLATRKDGANIEVNDCVFENLAAPSTGNTGVQVYASNVTMTFNRCTFNNMPIITNSSYPEGIKLVFNDCTFNWTGDNCPGFIQIANNLKIQVDINNCKMNYTTNSQYTTAKTMISYSWPEDSTININGLKVTGTRNNDKIWKICSSNNKVTVNTSGTLSYTFNGEAVDFNTYLK